MEMRDAEKELNSIQTDVTKLRDDFVALTRTLKSIMSDGADAAVGGLRQSAGRAQEGARHAAENVSHQIEQRPLASVLTAFGAGVLIGILFDRRS